MSDIFRKVRNMFTNIKSIFVSSEKPMDSYDKLTSRFKRECPLEIDEIDTVKKLCKEICVDEAKDLVDARFDTLKDIMMKSDIEMRCNSKIIVEDKKVNDSAEYKNFISKEYKRVCTDENKGNKKKLKMEEKNGRKKRKYKNEVSWGFLPKEWKLEEKNARADVIKYALTNQNEYWGPMIYFGDVPSDEEESYFDEKYYEKISKKKIKKPKIICEIGTKKTNCRKCLLYEFNQRRYNENVLQFKKERQREKEQNRFAREKWLNGFLYPNKIINNTFCDEDRIWLSYLFYKDFKFSDLNEKEKDLFFKRLKRNTIVCMKSLEKGEYNEMNEETRKKIEKNELFDIKDKVDNYINSNFFYDDVCKSLEEEEGSKNESDNELVSHKVSEKPIFNFYDDREDENSLINLDKLTDKVENEEFEKWKKDAIEKQKEIINKIKNKDSHDSLIGPENKSEDSVKEVGGNKAEFHNPFSKFLSNQEKGDKNFSNDVSRDKIPVEDKNTSLLLPKKEAVSKNLETEKFNAKPNGESTISVTKQFSNHFEGVKNDDLILRSDVEGINAPKADRMNSKFSLETSGLFNDNDKQKVTSDFSSSASLNLHSDINIGDGKCASENQQSFTNPFLKGLNKTHEIVTGNKNDAEIPKSNLLITDEKKIPFESSFGPLKFSGSENLKKSHNDDNKFESDRPLIEKKKDEDKVSFKVPEEFHYYPHYPHNPKKDSSIDPVVRVETHPPISRRKSMTGKESVLTQNGNEEINFNQPTSFISKNSAKINNLENSHALNTNNPSSSVNYNQAPNFTSYNSNPFASYNFTYNNSNIPVSSIPTTQNPNTFTPPSFNFQPPNVPSAPSLGSQSSSFNNSYVSFNQDYSSVDLNNVTNNEGNFNIQNNPAINTSGPLKRKREETGSKYAITDASSIKNPFLPKIDPQSLKPKERKFSDFSMMSFSPSNEKEFEKIQEIRNNKIDFLGEVSNPFETANPLAHTRDENLRFVDNTFKYSDIFNRDTSNIFLERNSIFNDMIFEKKEGSEDNAHIKYMKKEGENNNSLFGDGNSTSKDPWKK